MWCSQSALVAQEPLILLMLTSVLFVVLFMLIFGVNATRAPPPWVPLLVYVFLLLRLASISLNSLRELLLEQMAVVKQNRADGRIRKPMKRSSIWLATAGLVAFLFLVPLSIAAVVEPPSFSWMRVAYGVGFAPARFFQLAALSYPFGFVTLVMPLLLASCCCCRCFGKRKARNSQLRSLASRSPFIDLVENHTTIPLLTPLLFVYGFALPTSFVLAGSIRTTHRASDWAMPAASHCSLRLADRKLIIAAHSPAAHRCSGLLRGAHSNHVCAQSWGPALRSHCIRVPRPQSRRSAEGRWRRCCSHR